MKTCQHKMQVKEFKAEKVLFFINLALSAGIFPFKEVLHC
jgi:hypothetical protein